MEVDRDIRMTETFTEFLKALEPKVRKKYLYVIQVLKTEFLKALEPKVRKKYLYVIQVLKTESVVSEKFIKHLENTNLYEMRVSLSSNEYRTIVFSIDAVNIISATKVLLLNSFLKKDTKQYRSEINKAVKLLEEWRTEYEED